MAFVLSEQFKRHSFPYNSVFVSNFHYTAYYSVSQIETYPTTERSRVCSIRIIYSQESSTGSVKCSLL